MTSAAEAGGGLALTWQAVARARDENGPNEAAAGGVWRRGGELPLLFPC